MIVNLCVFDNHRRPDLKVCLVFCLCSSYILVSGLKTKQGDSASLFGYRSCYDPIRVRDLTAIHAMKRVRVDTNIKDLIRVGNGS